jgi:flagellar basal-body rod protein FlgB
LFLFDVASRHIAWLSERQSTTASNIANADTPGYHSRDIEPFSSVLETSAPALTVTSPMHMQPAGGLPDAIGQRAGASWDSAHSGNNVSIEQELMNAGSNSRMMNLDISLTRSFHRMLLSSLKV